LLFLSLAYLVFLSFYSRGEVNSIVIVYYPYLLLLIDFDSNPALLNKLKVKKGSFFNFPLTFWEIAPSRGLLFFFFLSMNNKFINNNGVNLQNTKNKKTKVEIQSIIVDQSQIELLKQKEQAINKECDNCQINYSAADNQITEITK